MVRRLASLALPFTGFTIAAAIGYGGPNLTALYGPGLSPGGQIFYASDPNWSTEVTQRWTTYTQPTYYGAIKPATEADVQHAVKVSVANNIPFLATGAGHGSSATLARLQNGIEIDLSNFKSVSLDAANNVLTVGGAVVFSQLYEPLSNAGKMLRMCGANT